MRLHISSGETAHLSSLASAHAAACFACGQDRANVVRSMWNMRRRHSSHSCESAAARTAVKGGRSLPVHRSEAQTLDGHRSGGYSRRKPRRDDCREEWRVCPVKTSPGDVPHIARGKYVPAAQQAIDSTRLLNTNH